MAADDEKKKRRTSADLGLEIADHQARLQVIAANYFALTMTELAATDREYLETLEKGLGEFVFVSGTAASIEKIRRLSVKMASVRREAFTAAADEVAARQRELAAAEVSWAEKVTKAMLPASEAEKIVEPSPARLDRIADNALGEGMTTRQYYDRLSADEAARVEAAIADGLANGDSIPEVAKRITGPDGVLKITRNAAERMTRTITNALANAAKDAFYQQNADIIVGVEIVATLDGRTCPICAGLDRKRYKMGENHPALPIHFNCRCVLLPLTALSAAIPENRPMARADFMAEAEKKYAAKFPGKDWAALAPSTKKRYYYAAMKEYERRTGQSAYTEAPGAVSFKKYFTTYMTEDQRRAWLGPERYEIWKRGNLPLSDFIPPYPNPRLTVDALRELDSASLRDAG